MPYSMNSAPLGSNPNASYNPMRWLWASSTHGASRISASAPQPAGGAMSAGLAPRAHPADPELALRLLQQPQARDDVLGPVLRRQPEVARGVRKVPPVQLLVRARLLDHENLHPQLQQCVEGDDWQVRGETAVQHGVVHVACLLERYPSYSARVSAGSER